MPMTQTEVAKVDVKRPLSSVTANAENYIENNGPSSSRGKKDNELLCDAIANQHRVPARQITNAPNEMMYLQRKLIASIKLK